MPVRLPSVGVSEGAAAASSAAGRAWESRRRIPLPALATALAVGVFLAVAILPLVLMVEQSFVRDGTFTLENYRAVLSSDRHLVLFMRTLAIGLGATMLALGVGVPFSLAAARTDAPFGRVLAYLLMAGVIVPPYFHAMAWTFLLMPNGLLGRLLDQLGLGAAPLSLLCTAPGAAVLLALAHLPYVVLMTMAGLRSMDGRLEEAAMLSRGWPAALARVTVPLAMPQILCAAVFVLIFTISDYGVPALLSVNTYPVEVFVQFSTFFEGGKATAVAVPLVVVAVLLLLVQQRYLRGRPLVVLSSASTPPVAIRLGRARWVVLLGMAIAALGAVVLPIGALVGASGGFIAYRVALATTWPVILESAGLAALAATAAVPLAFFLAYVIERGPRRLVRYLNLATLVPFAVPGTVLGIGLIRAWNRTGLEYIYGCWLVLVLAYVARLSPFAVRVMTSSLGQVDIQLEEAALLSKASWWSRLGRVVAPATGRGLAVAWFIVFVLAMGELGTTVLVVPPGHETLALKIYTLMHYGANELVAALCVILVGIGAAALAALALPLWGRRR